MTFSHKNLAWQMLAAASWHAELLPVDKALLSCPVFCDSPFFCDSNLGTLDDESGFTEGARRRIMGTMTTMLMMTTMLVVMIVVVE